MYIQVFIDILFILSISTHWYFILSLHNVLWALFMHMGYEVPISDVRINCLSHCATTTVQAEI